jgi:uncharacterized protein Usg
MKDKTYCSLYKNYSAGRITCARYCAKHVTPLCPEYHNIIINSVIKITHVPAFALNQFRNLIFTFFWSMMYRIAPLSPELPFLTQFLTFLQNLLAGAYLVVGNTNLVICSLNLKLQHTVFLILLCCSTTSSKPQISENCINITDSTITVKPINGMGNMDTLYPWPCCELFN